MLIEKLINSIENADELIFGEIADKIVEVRSEYDELVKKLASFQSTIKGLTNELETSKLSQITPPTYVGELEKTVIGLQTKLRDQTNLSISMPIITSEFKFTDTNLIVLREIKSAIYLNKLMEFILNTYRLRQKVSSTKSLLLVLDPLQDELRLQKYKKHKYPINNFNKEVPMLITNWDSLSLQHSIDLSCYQEVTVIDRYMREQPAVKHNKADTYYLIDSYSDIIDYNLSRAQCLAFVNAGENRIMHRVDPSIDISIFSPQEKAGVIATCPLIERLYCHEI